MFIVSLDICAGKNIAEQLWNFIVNYQKWNNTLFVAQCKYAVQ